MNAAYTTSSIGPITHSSASNRAKHLHVYAACRLTCGLAYLPVPHRMHARMLVGYSGGLEVSVSKFQRPSPGEVLLLAYAIYAPFGSLVNSK